MTEFFVGDVVKVEMPRGYSNRGVLGISLLYTTMPEARFDGASGTVTEIDPHGPYSVHQYLIDFRTHDNSRAGLPWQAQWFREEWLSLLERAPAAAVASPVAAGAARAGGGVATATRPAGTAATIPDAQVVERGDGYLRLSGVRDAPDDYPIKGVDNTRRFYLISDDEYAQTPPDVVFADEATAQRFGYTREGSAPTDGAVDPHTAQAGGFSWGEDSELAAQDLPASAPPTGRTTTTPEPGGYFGTPAVDEPVRDHAGEERGAGRVGPTATGDPAPTSGAPDRPAAADGGRSGATRDATAGGDNDVPSVEHTGHVSGAAPTAPSSPIGATDRTTTPAAAGADPAPDTTAPSGGRGSRRSAPVAAPESPSRGAGGGKELASEDDGGRSANQG